MKAIVILLQDFLESAPGPQAAAPGALQFENLL
jgi:hypothetical protein